MKKVLGYRTEKAKELSEQYTALYNEMMDKKAKMDSIYYEWLKMEGKYGKAVSFPCDYGNGRRGYHYEYENEELKKKEDKERADFLIANLYVDSHEVSKQYKNRLDALKQQFYMEQYGMSVEKKELADRINSEKKSIETKKQSIKEDEEYLKELMEKFNSMV